MSKHFGMKMFMAGIFSTTAVALLWMANDAWLFSVDHTLVHYIGLWLFGANVSFVTALWMPKS